MMHVLYHTCAGYHHTSISHHHTSNGVIILVLGIIILVTGIIILVTQFGKDGRIAKDLPSKLEILCTKLAKTETASA